MVSGSYTGGIGFFKGDGKGGFLAETKLKRADGKPLSDEYAQSPCLGDWDGDGDWDTVLGFISGTVKVFKNNGKLLFDNGTDITVQGKPMQKSDGGPCIVDWDGDGILDLLMGDGEGQVFFYKRTATGSNDLQEGVPLLAKRGADAWAPVHKDPKSPTGLSTQSPGVRTKPFAADWNNDGKLDLLVGDFMQVAGPAPKLTAAQVKERDRLRKATNATSQKLTPYYTRFSKAAEKASGVKMTGRQMTPEESKKWSDAYVKAMQADKEFNKLQKSM